jgi:hypothetical protein
VKFHGKRDFADVIKIGNSSWAQFNLTALRSRELFFLLSGRRDVAGGQMIEI